jgi:hypothetical protein
LITGCTHIRKYSTFDEINTKTKDKNAKITLISEQNLIGKDIYIAPDSTFWLNPNTKNKQSIITSEVSSIAFKNSWRGKLDGLLLGFLGGAVIGVTIGYLQGDDDPGMMMGLNAELKAVLGGIGLGGIGGLLGIPIGTIIGSNDKFIIENREKISIFNVDLSSPLTSNSVIKLEVTPHDILSIKNILEYELSSKGFDITEGFANYTIRFSYSINDKKRLRVFKATIYSMATDKIVGVANYRSNPYKETSITEIIKEFINQLYPEMK